MRKLYLLFLPLLLLACEGKEKQPYAAPIPKDNPVERPAIGNESFHFDSEEQIYHLRANNSEELRFLWSEIEGDFILDVKIPAVKDAGTYGLMLVTNLEEKTPIAALQIANNELAFMTAAQVNMGNAMTGQIEYLRLERSDNQLIASFARPNGDFFPIASQQLNNEVVLYGGLFAYATNEDLNFINLRLYYPTPESKEEAEKNVVSSVEIFDLPTRQRKIIFQKNARIESPNWHPTDSFLLVNSEGVLYQIPLSAKAGWQAFPMAMKTNFLNNFTAYHGFSRDGKQLFFSHQDSTATSIYKWSLNDTIPPEIIVSKTPSFWQAVSPDGTEILYTAKRKKRRSLNVYKSAVDSFSETRITKTLGINRGVSFHPDNERIYFGAPRAHQPKIWVMNKNSLRKNAITTDEYEDFFPQVSPDGKYLLFLSRYLELGEKKDLAPQKFVIRLLDLTKEDAQARIIAHLIAGEGSMLMPSWSPDSQQFAFISYSFAPQKLVVEAKNKQQLEM
ncbi:MAG: hypothetical protein AAGG68_03615 [Bacteroidota bacterium]